MSLILSASLLAATATLPTCSWDHPGRNVFMGDVVGAVDRYTDIPKDVREALKKRMAKRQYDDVAAIKRDTIQGKRSYTDLREMHFGPGTVCKTISRKKWTDKWEERGLVYCEKGHCIIVPTVCRNVSRVNLKQDDPLEFDTAAGPAKEPEPDPPPLQLPMPTEAPKKEMVPWSDLFRYPKSLAVSWMASLGAQTAAYGIGLWAPTLFVLQLGVTPAYAAYMVIWVLKQIGLAKNVHDRLPQQH